MWIGERDPALARASISAFGALLRRTAVPLGIWLLVCLAGGVIYLRTVGPEFIAGVQLVLQSQKIAQDGPEQLRTSDQFAIDWRQAETELNVVRSQRLLRDVFDALQLQNDPELRSEEGGFWNGLSRLVRGLLPADPPRDATAIPFNNFVRRVSARRLALSYVIEVAYRSGNPAQAERVANALAAAYLTYRITTAQHGMPYLEGSAQRLLAETMIATDAMRTGTVPDQDFANAGVRVLGPARRPLAKALPKAGPVMAVALCWGAVLGLLAAALMQRFDRRVRSGRSLSPGTSEGSGVDGAQGRRDGSPP